jgi:ABC-type Zn uptake system ZnuABC Zn-binding protein ZnuA
MFRLLSKTACLAALSVAALTLACGGSGGGASPSPAGQPTPTPFVIPDRPPTELDLPVRVAVTLPLFEEWVREAGGENVEVISLLPPGADPRSHHFSPEDIAAFGGVKFFFVNAGGLDNQLMASIEAGRDEDAYVIPFAPNVRSPSAEGLYADEAGDNPHLWLDPLLAFIYPEIIADTFVIYDGVRESFYNNNFFAIRERYAGLRTELAEEIASIPPERRKLVTSHDAFVHYANRFGLEIAGFLVPRPGQAVNEAHLQELAALIREQGIPAVFAIFGYDASALERLAEQAGVQVCTLYADIVGGNVTTYEEMMRANTSEIVRCLAG